MTSSQARDPRNCTEEELGKKLGRGGFWMVFSGVVFGIIGAGGLAVAVSQLTQ